MAEIVEYRVEKTLNELKLLVDFGLFSEEHAKEVVKKRQDFEYRLRRRQLNQLDYLKYIQFEWNLLRAIEEYRRKIIKSNQKIKKTEDNIDEIDRKLLLLQAKKLNDVIRSRSAHISSLFRKLTTKYQFDSSLWLAYIAFAKSRFWNSRVSALYWRVLRVSGHDATIWISAAQHEVETNKAYDTARGLLLRALRHHPDSYLVWAEYFKMELIYMDVLERRARIIFKTSKSDQTAPSNPAEPEDIWAEDPLKEDEDGKPDEDVDPKAEPIPEAKTKLEDKTIIAGHLPRVVYEKSVVAIADPRSFIKYCIEIFKVLLEASESQGIINVKKFIMADLKKRHEENDERVTLDLLNLCESSDNFNKLLPRFDDSPVKKQKLSTKLSNMEKLYECYESKGIDDTRELFYKLENSSGSQSLSLYVGMIQVEQWQLKKDSSDQQLTRIRAVYEKALMKYGKTKPKLWYEYLQFEHEHSNRMEDLERINQIYTRAQNTLIPCKVDRVIERYSILQAKLSDVDIEYSDYSDLDD